MRYRTDSTERNRGIFGSLVAAGDAKLVKAILTLFSAQLIPFSSVTFARNGYKNYRATIQDVAQELKLSSSQAEPGRAINSDVA